MKTFLLILILLYMCDCSPVKNWAVEKAKTYPADLSGQFEEEIRVTLEEWHRQPESAWRYWCKEWIPAKLIVYVWPEERILEEASWMKSVNAGFAGITNNWPYVVVKEGLVNEVKKRVIWETLRVMVLCQYGYDTEDPHGYGVVPYWVFKDPNGVHKRVLIRLGL